MYMRINIDIIYIRGLLAELKSFVIPLTKLLCGAATHNRRYMSL